MMLLDIRGYFEISVFETSRVDVLEDTQERPQSRFKTTENKKDLMQIVE